MGNMHRDGRNFAHTVSFEELLWNAKLASISSTPHVQLSVICYCAAVIAPTLCVNYSFTLKSSANYQLWLSVACIIAVSQCS